MAKPPNLLNNLLKAFRVRRFGKKSLLEVAKDVNELAKEQGDETRVSADYLSKVEGGTLEKPNEDKLLLMLKAYGCSLEWRNCLDSLRGRVIDGAVGYDEPDEAALPLSGGAIGNMFVRRVITGPIPSSVLDAPDKHETLITPSALFASWDRPLGGMVGGSFYPTRWIDQPYTAPRFREILCAAKSSVFLLPVNYDHAVLTHGHASVECIENILLIRTVGQRATYTANPDEIELFFEEFNRMKADAYPADVAGRILSAVRDAWHTVYHVVHPPGRGGPNPVAGNAQKSPEIATEQPSPKPAAKRKKKP